MKTEQEIIEEKKVHDNTIFELQSKFEKYGDTKFHSVYWLIKDFLPKDKSELFQDLISFYNHAGCVAALEWVIKKPYDNPISEQELPYDLYIQLQSYSGMNVHDFNGAIGNLRFAIKKRDKTKALNALVKLKKFKPSLVWSENWVNDIGE